MQLDRAITYLESGQEPNLKIGLIP